MLIAQQIMLIANWIIIIAKLIIIIANLIIIIAKKNMLLAKNIQLIAYLQLLHFLFQVPFVHSLYAFLDFNFVVPAQCMQF